MNDQFTDRIWDVYVVVKELRRYRIKARNLATAEDIAIENAENPGEFQDGILVSSDLFDGAPYIHESRDVTDDFKPEGR